MPVTPHMSANLEMLGWWVPYSSVLVKDYSKRPPPHPSLLQLTSFYICYYIRNVTALKLISVKLYIGLVSPKALGKQVVRRLI
jgi:hypothetical protein